MYSDCFVQKQEINAGLFNVETFQSDQDIILFSFMQY